MQRLQCSVCLSDLYRPSSSKAAPVVRKQGGVGPAPRRLGTGRMPQSRCQAGSGDSSVDDGSYDKPPLDKRAAVMALENLFASSVEIDDDGEFLEGHAAEGLPVWCHGNAMLPGFREVLGVHQPVMIAMFTKLLNKPQPWRYVHFSRSSNFAEAAQLQDSPEYRAQNQDSSLLPSSDPGRPAVGTLMEIVVADRADDGRLFLAVRALGAVQLQRVTQRSPHVRAVVEWRPDQEEVEAAGGEAPAVCAAEAWASLWESPLDEDEFEGIHPIGTHIVEVAKRFNELAAPRGEAAAAAAAASEAADMVSTSKTRTLAAAYLEQSRAVEGPEGPHGAEAALLMTPVWKSIQRIEELQASIAQGGQKGAPAPTAARAMRPLLRPHVAAALEPLLAEEALEWPPARRLRWLSFAVAAMLPEVALGPGRQALLEATSAEARMSLAYEVLSARQESLSALLALQRLQDEHQEDTGIELEGGGGRSITLKEAARLERLAQRGSSSSGRWTLGAREDDGDEAPGSDNRRARLRWLQSKAIQEAAECQLINNGDDSKCEVEWQRVKDLSEMAKDDDNSDS